MDMRDPWICVQTKVIKMCTRVNYVDNALCERLTYKTIVNPKENWSILKHNSVTWLLLTIASFYG